MLAQSVDIERFTKSWIIVFVGFGAPLM